LYVRCGCSLRKTEKILRLFNERLKWELEEIPSPNSIGNRVEKCGYYIYKTTGSEDFPEGYATIVDESMMVGSEKLLLTLGVASEKRGTKSLTESDIKVLDMSVKKSWNSSEIGEVCEKIEEKMYSAPSPDFDTYFLTFI
jgi:hypothetical protein